MIDEQTTFRLKNDEKKSNFLNKKGNTISCYCSTKLPVTSIIMPSLKSHRIKRGLMKLVPKWKNDQAGKSFYLFFIGSCFMFASFLANAVSLSFPQFTSEQNNHVINNNFLWHRLILNSVSSLQKKNCIFSSTTS